MSPRQKIVGWLLVSLLGLVPLPRICAQQPRARVILGVRHDVGVESLASGPDGKTLASAESDGAIRLLDVRTGGEIRRFKHAGLVSSVTFSPDGKTVAAGGSDATGGFADLRLIDVATGRLD